MKFSAVVLAGGRSARMGKDKAFLLFRGRPLIQHSLDRVRAAGAGEVLISGRVDQDFSGLGCPVLLDVKPDCGPLGGLERALEVARYPMVLVVAVDLPRMTPNCLRWLAARCTERLGVVPEVHGFLEPLASFYPKLAHALVSRRLREARFSARSFAEQCLQEGLAVRAQILAEYEACLENWNTPEDVGGE